MNNLRNSKSLGQNLAELSLCMAVITTAFVSMQLYVQRNLQAKQKSAMDYLFSTIKDEVENKSLELYDTIKKKEADNADKQFPDDLKDFRDNLAARLRSLANLNKLKGQYEVSYKESIMTEINGTEAEPNIIVTGFPDSTINKTTTRSGWEKTSLGFLDEKK